MAIEQIAKMLQSCKTENPLFPPTILFNEGWMLRLVLDWFSKHKVSEHPLAFSDEAKWFSEALLPTTFEPRMVKELAESWTHADGIIGHFKFDPNKKAALELDNPMKQLVVIEAKMFSGLSASLDFHLI